MSRVSYLSIYAIVIFLVDGCARVHVEELRARFLLPIRTLGHLLLLFIQSFLFLQWFLHKWWWTLLLFLSLWQCTWAIDRSTFFCLCASFIRTAFSSIILPRITTRVPFTTTLSAAFFHFLVRFRVLISIRLRGWSAHFLCLIFRRRECHRICYHILCRSVIYRLYLLQLGCWGRCGILVCFGFRLLSGAGPLRSLLI